METIVQPGATSSSRGGHGGVRGRGGFRGGNRSHHPYDNNARDNARDSNNNYARGRSTDNFRRGGSSNRVFQGTCFKCNQFGHRANACPRQNTNSNEQGNFVADDRLPETIFMKIHYFSLF